MSLKIIPLAAESMGTRSMATYIECGRFRILIDPGASLAGSRYHLPPHPLEKWRLQKHMERIHLFAGSSHAIIITCFHSDHFSDELIDIYRDKLIFMQNPNVHIRAPRRKRAFQFLNQIKGLTKDTIYMDNRIFELNNLRLVFSKPVRSSHDEQEDFVVPVSISHGNETFIFSSNIEGLFQQSILEWMIKQNPTFLYLDGPDTSSRSNTSRTDRIEQFISMMEQMMTATPLKNIILDHHITRDLKWQYKMTPFLKLGQYKKITIQTAAEYRGENNDFFEARRKKLYQDEPVSRR
ncbi:hypothetical protein JW835_03110 [bacterium]|nr:hypothetical protein [bacterium]